jgi:hypothetical protein
MKEIRVYVVDVHSDTDELIPLLSDEEFMNVAECNGTVYTLQGFQHAFNNDLINSSEEFIRIIEVEV